MSDTTSAQTVATQACAQHLDTQSCQDAPGANKVILAQVVQGLVQDDSASLEPHRLLELEARKLLQVLHTSHSDMEGS